MPTFTLLLTVYQFKSCANAPSPHIPQLLAFRDAGEELLVYFSSLFSSADNKKMTLIFFPPWLGTFTIFQIFTRLCLHVGCPGLPQMSVSLSFLGTVFFCISGEIPSVLFYILFAEYFWLSYFTLRILGVLTSC